MSESRPIRQLRTRPVDIFIFCGCPGSKNVDAEWLIERLGRRATLEDAERRLKCGKCGQRPRLQAKLTFQAVYAIQRGNKPPDVPDWVER